MNIRTAIRRKRMLRKTRARRLDVEQLECRRLLALNPSAGEQELMQLVNRFRTDPAGEFSRLMTSASPLRSRDPIMQADLDFAKVNGTLLRTELGQVAETHPLVWNEAINDYTAAHNAKMIAQKNHFHSNTLQRRTDLIAAGVNFRFANGEKINSENVFGFGKSPLHIYASYLVDWQQGVANGMQSGRPHRVAISNPDFEQLGHSITAFGGSGFGPHVNSQILANIENPPVMVTGAIFEDQNGSGWYEAGEGLRSVQFVFQGEAGRFTTTGFTTGGYQIELPPGTYTATATGGGMKFPQSMTNIVVEDVNVWKNWIYDPDVIPADSLEANNSRQTATRLTGANQTLSNLSIHTAADVDYFRLDSVGTGSMKVDLQFTHSAGNLDLRLLSATGAVLASSTSTTNNESLTANVTRGTTYYVQVAGVSGSRNGSFNLVVSPPQATPPRAVSDQAIFNASPTPIVIDVLANDDDPDGDNSKLVPMLAAGTHSAFSLDSNNRVRYSAPANYSGVHRANYSVTDDQGLTSAMSSVEVFVVNYNAVLPWQNTDNPTDVNDDGITTPLDALLVINELNRASSRSLPTAASSEGNIFGFIDSSGDGFVSPQDALQVINRLNLGEGEGEKNYGVPPLRDEHLAVDAAMLQMSRSEWLDDWSGLKRRRR